MKRSLREYGIYAGAGLKPAPVILSMAILALGTLATNSSLGDPLGRQADSLYVARKFPEAAKLYTEVSKTATAQDRIKYNYFAAKSFYRANDFDAARERFTSLLEGNTPSYVKTAAHFFLGNIAFHNGELTASVQHYLDAYDSETNQSRRQIYLESLKPLFAHHLLARDSENMLGRVRDRSLADELFCSYAEKLLAEKQYDYLTLRAEQRLLSEDDTPCRQRLEKLVDEAKFLQAGSPRVGLVVPLSGSYAPYGNSIKEGVELAFAEFEKETGQKVELLAEDCGDDPASTAVRASRLFDQPISAIIGPLTSSAAISVASLARCRNIPIVSPTASEEDAHEIASSYFQVSPSVGSMSRLLAEFVVTDLRFDTIAVIYPEDKEGIKAVEAFVPRIKEAGKHVIYYRSFPENATDFRDILLELKGAVNPELAGASLYLTSEGDTLETEEVPVSLQAIYIPAGETQLQLIVPQINFYKIKATFLGGASWGSEIVSVIPELAEADVYFSDDIGPDEASASYHQFRRKYEMSYNRPPDAMAPTAYDVATLLADAFREVGSAPENVLQYLKSPRSFVGVGCEIRWNEENDNQAVAIYHLTGGKASRVR